MRLLELRDLIAAEEVKFKYVSPSSFLRPFIDVPRHLVTEINEIRSGNWDDKIRTKLSGEEPEPNQAAISPEEQSSAVHHVCWLVTVH